MFTLEEKEVLSIFLTSQVEKNRKMIYRDMKNMNNEEFDKVVRWISEDIRLRDEINNK